MFQIHECFKGTVQLLLVGPTGSFITSDLLSIESLNYTDGFYEMNWNIKLHKHSLYYLTVSALDTTGASNSVTEISKTLSNLNINYYIFNTQIHIM